MPTATTACSATASSPATDVRAYPATPVQVDAMRISPAASILVSPTWTATTASSATGWRLASTVRAPTVPNRAGHHHWIAKHVLRQRIRVHRSVQVRRIVTTATRARSMRVTVASASTSAYARMPATRPQASALIDATGFPL
jgi:hypothetical protein